MTSPVLRHYEALLAPIYSWMLGDFDARVTGSEALFRTLLPPPAATGARALDLGCGTGVETLALARLGFTVTGIDFSPLILEEHRARTRAVSATSVKADLTAFDVGTGFDAAVCVGDTVAHLPTWDAVRAMFARVHAALTPGGGFVLATRDHTAVYEGEARFLLVRADAEQTLTCFLEDAGSHVRVTDIVHRREGAAVKMAASSYAKLRVSPDLLAAELARAGFEVGARPAPRAGVHVVVARKQ